MKRILIAEDKTSSRELLKTVLELQGYEVLEAGDGEEALHVVRNEDLHLVLLDLQMPLRDGYQVVHEIRSDDRLCALPVIALTANAMPEDRERVMAAGFTSYVSKPVALAELRAEIARLLKVEQSKEK